MAHVRVCRLVMCNACNRRFGNVFPLRVAGWPTGVAGNAMHGLHHNCCCRNDTLMIYVCLHRQCLKVATSVPPIFLRSHPPSLLRCKLRADVGVVASGLSLDAALGRWRGCGESSCCERLDSRSKLLHTVCSCGQKMMEWPDGQLYVGVEVIVPSFGWAGMRIHTG